MNNILVIFIQFAMSCFENGSAMSSSVQELFNVSDQLAKNLDITHKLAVPKISKIVINAGIGTIKEDNKAIEKMKKELSLITGQAPVVRL